MSVRLAGGGSIICAGKKTYKAMTMSTRENKIEMMARTLTSLPHISCAACESKVCVRTRARERGRERGSFGLRCYQQVREEGKGRVKHQRTDYVDASGTEME